MCSLRNSWSLALALSLLVGSGCSESSSTDTAPTSDEHAHSHDDHDHGPESLKDAMAELTSMRDAIRDAFAKKDPDPHMIHCTKSDMSWKPCQGLQRRKR